MNSYTKRKNVQEMKDLANSIFPQDKTPTTKAERVAELKNLAK